MTNVVNKIKNICGIWGESILHLGLIWIKGGGRDSGGAVENGKGTMT